RLLHRDRLLRRDPLPLPDRLRLRHRSLLCPDCPLRRDRPLRSSGLLRRDRPLRPDLPPSSAPQPGFEPRDPVLARLPRSLSDAQRLSEVAELMLENLGPRLARVWAAGIAQPRRTQQLGRTLPLTGPTLEPRQLERRLAPPL